MSVFSEKNENSTEQALPLILYRTAASVRTVKFKTTVPVAPVFRCVDRVERRKEVFHNSMLNLRDLKLLFVAFKLKLGIFFSWSIF